MIETAKFKKSQIGLNEVLSIQANSIMEALNCHNIGKITKFYPETQTADIQILILKQIQETTIYPTILCDVPLIIYGAGGGYITLPDPTGSLCLLFFIDRDIDDLMLTGEAYVPASNRMHDFTDCIAITTFNTSAKPLTNYDTNAITIEFKNSTIKINNDITINAKDKICLKSDTKIILDTPETETTGNLKVATGYTGIIPCGNVNIQVTKGIITGVT